MRALSLLLVLVASLTLTALAAPLTPAWAQVTQAAEPAADPATAAETAADPAAGDPVSDVAQSVQGAVESVAQSVQGVVDAAAEVTAGVTNTIQTTEPQNTLEDVPEVIDGLWGQFTDFVQSILLRPWNAYQLLIALGLFLSAHLLKGLLAPRLYEWMRSREGWPKWRYRYLLLLHGRLRLVLFVLLIWPVIWIMREVTWPSRSYILGGIGQLTFAWLLITILTRVINNTLIRDLVRYLGWSWVTLDILNLTEPVYRLLDSLAFNLGSMHISVWLVIKALVIIGALIAFARFISSISAAQIRKNEDISPSMQVLAIKILQIALFSAAFFIGLKSIGVDLTGLAVLSGAIGLGLGFGLQKVVSNLVSGVIILLDKSIKPGDVISLGDTFGWINALGARYVSVVTRDGKEYLIPNEDLITGQVVNWSHSNAFVRLDIFFGTAYHDDPHKVRKIAIEAASGVERVLTDKPAVCHIVGFGDHSVDYVLRFWISDPTGGLTNIRGNVFLALWDAFEASGISIPFPQREVRLLKDSDDRAPQTDPGADPVAPSGKSEDD